MVDLTEVDAILQKIGEGAVGEGDAALVLGDLRIAPLGDNAPAVELGDQFAERPDLEIQLENLPDRLGFSLVDDQLLVPGIVTERNGATRPFSLLARGSNLVLDPLGGQLPFELRKG